jgi:hypothetical protein
MLSAFGVEHGAVSKRDDRRVPDVISGALPGSTVHAYNRSGRHKKEAATRNFLYSTGATVAGGAAGIGLAGMALRRGKASGKLPKFFAESTPYKNPFTGNKTKFTADEKQRWLGRVTAGAVGGSTAGAAAGAIHLKHLDRQRKYDYKKEEK